MDKERGKMIPSRKPTPRPRAPTKSAVKPCVMSENIENTTSESDDEAVHVTLIKSDANSRRPSSIVHSSFPPTKVNLAVNKTKVDAVEAWLISALAKKNSGLLWINGPTGSGKTATVQAVAAANRVHIMEWTSPMDDFYEHTGFPNQNYTSQTQRFEEFVIFGSRYNSVLGPEISDKLILVEDFPNAFLMNSSPFHEILRKYAWMGKCPLVFITTQTNTGIKMNRDLFPEKLMSDLRITEISFNAIATTFMAKAIDRLACVHNREDVSYEVRQSICQAANGDIRNAAQMWAFHTQVPLASLKDKLPKKAVPKSGKRKAYKRQSGIVSFGSAVALLDCKDPAAGMMPSLGRVLYAKREVMPAAGCGTDLDKRGFFKTNPQDIIDQFTPDHRFFVGMCHENYVTIFEDLESISQASEQLSFADIILGAASMDSDMLREIGFSIAVRGLMNACNKTTSTWKPLRKDRWPEISQQTVQHVQRVREIYAGTTLCTTQDLLIDVIPTRLRKQPYFGLACSRLEDDGPQSPVPHITDTDTDTDVD